jgi:hypothetical protein
VVAVAKKELIFRIDLGGEVTSLWNDTINLLDLGEASVRRASHVEFDNERQGWVIFTPEWTEISGQPRGGFKVRGEALRFEEEWANEKVATSTE